MSQIDKFNVEITLFDNGDGTYFANAHKDGSRFSLNGTGFGSTPVAAATSAVQRLFEHPGCQLRSLA